MIKRALFGVAFGVAVATAGAQTPTPTPAPPVPPPPPRAEKVRSAQPRPAPEVRELIERLLPRLDFDLAPIPPIPPMDMVLPMALEPFGAEPLLHFDDGRGFDGLFALEGLEGLAPTLAFDGPLSFDLLPPLESLDALGPMMFESLEPMMFESMIPPEPMITLEPMLPTIPLDLEAPVPPVPPVSDFFEIPVTPEVAHAPSGVWHIPGQSRFEQQFGDITSEPPQAWAQADPADSLYRLARQTLNRGEYRRAAQLFGDITQRLPNSAYAADARYWKAFALYRIGGTGDLRDALAALDSDGRRYYQASLKADAATLASRIRGALAQRGDVRSITMVERTAGQQGEPCDKEDAAVRVEALKSLGDMDQESTTPIFRRILAKRDGCSASLRRSALFLLARRGDPEATALIISSARNDTDPHVRSDALRWLAKMPGDQALATLEEIARTPGNESLQRSAVAALARSESPRARQAIRNIIERSDVPETLRATALSSVVGEQSADGGAYLRSVYPRLESSRLKLGAIRAIARIGGGENERWLLSIVRNQSEPLDVRSTALTYAARSTIPISDLVGMYDAAGERPLRTRLISLYGSRSEPEAADKLMAIAKTGTDPEMRRLAISALSRRNDPRTKKLLLEILDQ